MNTDKDGGPAFPHHYDMGGPFPNYTSGSGMSLRDWFAGQALAGIIADLSENDVRDLAQGVRGGKFITGAAYALADAMLKARASATPARGDTDGR